MSFQKVLFYCVAFQCASRLVESQETSIVNLNCPSEACPIEDKFCTYERDPSTCECNAVMCCDLPYCPKGYDVCDSCENCKCREECPSDPCPPSQSNFCAKMKDEFCNCLEICCSPPFCETGIDWSRCVSCGECPCLEDSLPETSVEPTTEIIESSTLDDCSAPCPSSASSFCYNMRIDCKCVEVCCAPPICEGSHVDWANCISCAQCPCLPIEPSTVEDITTTSCTTTITQRPCAITCQEKFGCKTRIDQESCRCEYDCVTKPRKKKIKCKAVN